MSIFSPEKIAAFHQLPSMTPKIFQRLLELPGIDSVDWSALGADGERGRALHAEMQRINPAQIREILNRLSATVIIRGQPNYSRLLEEIPSPPPVLYVRGNVEVLSSTSLAVVGTRKPTSYGTGVTQGLVSTAVRAGITIVSGLAYGIDAVAHRTALKNHGVTIAVLGSGIDLIYPSEHRQLADDILAAGGAIISEFPLGARPERHHFPQRNRIISGLSKAVLLVEAGFKSGALITAKFAVDQNREVLAVPGPITSPQSVGPNNWLKLGAKLVSQPEDILELYAPRQASLATIQPRTSDDPTEAVILEILRDGQIHIDEIVIKSRLDTSVVSATLSILEIRGFVQHHGGMIYSQAT